ncbi:putative hypoxia induced protein conserved region [Lyophyllum shimeji]|uniref:Hypoxia induced protein conserved region n=1 Tax=Lyophyllum shimeji TaxID=47721 RepID=A0A9P3ULX6_LYOSH|nr:putative hypoxia induced protein conserved region [Lyophyllum shimeji]
MSSAATVAKPRHVPGMETYREKAARKFKENPWVPLGSMATVGALVVAMVKMRRGQSQSFNHWLRVRVAAQGLTIVAIVVGAQAFRPKDAEAPGGDAGSMNDVDAERRRMEKLAREKDEFEERLRGAEEAHELEKGLRAGRSGFATTSSGSQGGAGDGATVLTKSGGGWFGWLGWGRSRSSDSPSSTNPGNDSTTKS